MERIREAIHYSNSFISRAQTLDFSQKYKNPVYFSVVIGILNRSDFIFRILRRGGYSSTPTG